MLTRLTHSVSGRLLITASIFLLFFLSLTGLALDRAFRSSTETAMMERLTTHLYTLLAAAEHSEGKLLMPALLQDPGFNQINSGLYAIITDAQNNALWRSQSALSLPLDYRITLPGGEQLYQALDGSGERIFAYSYGVIWEGENGQEHHYTFSVLRSDAPVVAEINSFRVTLWRWLGGICVLLLSLQWIIMRWGLRPVNRLAADLRLIETGAKEQLTGTYLKELQGVATNLNHLISNERTRRQRYRNTLADLAHSLKTPLALLRGTISKRPELSHDDLTNIDEQIGVMDQIISYQLQRASAPDATILTKAVTIAPLAEKLLRNLSKVYAEKQVTYEMQIDAKAQFLGDEHDLTEILGNLVDNAFKYCHRHVVLRSETLVSRNRLNSALKIVIEDDGRGIRESQYKTVLQRGIRADLQKPGQGIGLAIAQDILAGYGGKLEIGRSELGGAAISIGFS